MSKLTDLYEDETGSVAYSGIQFLGGPTKNYAQWLEQHLTLSEQVIEGLRKEKEAALEIAMEYGRIDGGHHKMWVIDQIVRTLAGERYEQLIREYKDGEDGPDTYEWDEGIAP